MWYLVLSRLVAEGKEIQGHVPEHLAWMERQHKAGTVLFSGPTIDRMHGIYVIRAESMDEAKQIAASDPFHVLGLREAEILEWEVHQILGTGSFEPRTPMSQPE